MRPGMLEVEVPVRWERIAAAILMACVAIVLTTALTRSRTNVGSYFSYSDLAMAENLLHGLPSASISTNLPMQSVVTGLIFNHGPFWLQQWAPELLWVGTLALVFTLGCLLRSLLCGGLAALLMALAVPFSGFYFMSVYAFLVLLAANVMVWAAGQEQAERSSASWRYAALGLALGLTLLQRSPLFLFPFLLAGYLWALRCRQGTPAPIKEIFLLCALPFVLLLPWMRLNWLSSGEWVLFEHGRARFNIITGAMGHVSTLEGRLVDIGPSARDNVLFWAVTQVLLHPLVYLCAFALRLWTVLSLHPWLMALAVFSGWLFRRSPRHQQVVLLAAYYVSIHCLMPVKPSYFDALWPIVAALAASSLTALLRPASDLGKRTCAVVVGVALASASVLGAYTLYIVFVYPGHAAEPARLAAEVDRHPELSCLRAEYGRLLLRQGQVEAAVFHLRRAQLGSPRKDREIDLAWGLLAQGGSQSSFIDGVDLTAGTWDDRVKGHIVRMLGALQRDRRQAAMADFVEADRLHAQPYNLALGSTSKDQDAQRNLALSDTGIGGLILDLLQAWPVKRQVLLLERFRVSILPSFPTMRFPGQSGHQFEGENILAQAWLDRAERAEQSNQRRAALESLAFAESLRLDPERTRELALAYRDLGSYSRSLSVLKRADMKGPKDVDLLLDLAVRAARDNQRSAALEISAFVESLKLDPESIRQLALQQGRRNEPASRRSGLHKR